MVSLKQLSDEEWPVATPTKSTTQHRVGAVSDCPQAASRLDRITRVRQCLGVQFLQDQVNFRPCDRVWDEGFSNFSGNFASRVP
jgi:hypothetical protein